MSLTVIIAEKPSLARNIADAIGNYKRRDGYLQAGEYIVTWAFGHLFSLADIETYNPKVSESKYWTMENIPCFPDKFIFELKKDKNRNTDQGVVKQFETIKSLCMREEVSTIVNAGDSDREGEIIIRICLNHIFNNGASKQIKRLWLPDQTPQTIRQELAQLRDDAQYDCLANEGYARTYIDWLYGVNLTRYATLKTGTLIRVGRVIVPIVKAIYDRDMAIKNFIPDIYYAVVSKTEVDSQEIILTSKQKFDKNKLNEAQKLCDQFNSFEAVVMNVKKRKSTVSPGKLYSLTKLQNALGKRFKMPMDESLAIVQKLYEAGYVTYPRTNSEYLASAEKDKVKSIIDVFSKLGYNLAMKEDKTIFDDSKIESHSALTPTYKVPDKNHMTDNEYKVYSTIVKRFAAVFCAQPCLADKTEITVDVGGLEQFVLKGMVITQEGWTKYDIYTSKDRILPALKKGDTFSVDFKPQQKETSPPRHYTIETLNNYLKNPFKDEKAAAADQENKENEDDTEEYRAVFEGLELGTEATRTGIIENAIKSKYILLKKDVYYILPDGIYLVEALSRMKIGMDKYKTSEMGRALKKVYRNEIAVSDSISIVRNEIEAVFNKAKEQSPQMDTDDGFAGDEAGKCPLCGGEVVRTRFGYGCRNYKEGCRFSISGVICSRIIPIAQVRKLLDTGKTDKLSGFISKKGKPFDGALKLENGKAVFDFS
ncbi:MAG: DNA topoisomerase [Oscillospiraceae bacterium]|nr:DNA topoisomerase [Oscillospiraceae bacterium]